MYDEYDRASDDHRSERYRKAQKITGQDIPREPTSAELARRFIEAVLEVAKGSSGPVADTSALGLISIRLAIAAENNLWVREWLAAETESFNRQIKAGTQP